MVFEPIRLIYNLNTITDEEISQGSATSYESVIG